MEVEEVPFADLLSKIVDNRGRTCPTAETGLPLIATNCVRNDLLYPAFEKVRYVSKDTYDNWFRGHPVPGDLIFVCKGTPGRVCMTPDPVTFCIAQDMVAVRANPEKVYPKYLFALLRSQRVQAQIGNMHVGTLIPHFKKGDFDKLLLPVPDKKTQETIGDAYFELSAKIELNWRMNATLESMSRALFQSWFVDFDPVRAKLDGREVPSLDNATVALFPNEFEDSELGHIPKGWKVGRLGQYLETEIGGDWGEDDRFDGGIEVAALRGVDLEHLRERGDANAPRRWVKESSLAKRRMSDRDILVASSGAGPCGRPIWVSPHLEAAFPVPVLYSNFCKRYRAATPAQALYFDRVLFEMRASGEIWDFINGTSLPNLDSNGLMTGKSVLVPPLELLEKFASFVEPIYERLYSREPRTLSTLRDTLLPKLLGGELRIAA